MMRHNLKSIMGIDRNSQFSTRVLILSIPSALIFVALTLFDQLSPLLSFVCYIVIILFNMVSLFPISYELQALRKYIYSLANERYAEQNSLKLSEKDAQELAEAINSIHRFWTSKTDTLEAQTISDAAVLDTLPDPIRKAILPAPTFRRATFWAAMLPTAVLIRFFPPIYLLPRLTKCSKVKASRKT